MEEYCSTSSVPAEWTSGFSKATTSLSLSFVWGEYEEEKKRDSWYKIAAVLMVMAVNDSRFGKLTAATEICCKGSYWMTTETLMQHTPNVQIEKQKNPICRFRILNRNIAHHKLIVFMAGDQRFLHIWVVSLAKKRVCVEWLTYSEL